MSKAGMCRRLSWWEAHQLFPGMAEVVAEYTNIPTWVPPNPLFVTPLGIALHDMLQ